MDKETIQTLIKEYLEDNLNIQIKLMEDKYES
jgi:hypothetical protein